MIRCHDDGRPHTFIIRPRSPHEGRAQKLGSFKTATRVAAGARRALFSSSVDPSHKARSPHLLPVPELKWEKEEGGLFSLARSEYDLACGQV